MLGAVRRLVGVVVLLVVSTVVFAGDLKIKVGGLLGKTVAEALPVAETGTVLYDTQEGLHQTVTATTSVAVPHEYVWVCTGNECVPVDPFEVGN